MFSGIKTGRYTHEKRTRDTVEIKRLELKHSPLDCITDQLADVRLRDINTVLERMREVYLSVAHTTAKLIIQIKHMEFQFLVSLVLHVVYILSLLCIYSISMFS